jgi:hypothetical protein
MEWKVVKQHLIKAVRQRNAVIMRIWQLLGLATFQKSGGDEKRYMTPSRSIYIMTPSRAERCPSDSFSKMHG